MNRSVYVKGQLDLSVDFGTVVSGHRDDAVWSLDDRMFVWANTVYELFAQNATA